MSIPSLQFRLLIPLLTAPFLAACNGSDISVTGAQSVAETLTTRPLDHTDARRMAAAVSNSNATNLLVNGDFSDSANGWISCSGDNLQVIDVNGQSAAVVAPADCVQQAVTIAPGDNLVLECDAQRRTAIQNWTGLGISFYDSEWQFISEPSPALINNSSDFGRYTVAGEAPTGAAYAGIWLYSDADASLTNCILENTDELPDTGGGGLLLYNGNFDQRENNLPVGWTDYCGGFVESVGGVYVGDVRIGSGACLTQSLSSSAISTLRGQPFRFVCEMFNGTVGSYGELGTNLTGTHTSTPLITNSSGSFTLSGTTAADIDNAYVSIYIEGDRPRYILDCRLNSFEETNQAPVAVDDTYVFQSTAEPISIPDLKISENDYDPDGTLNYSSIVITQYPSVGTVTINGYVVAYESDTRADDSFRYYIADGANKVSEEATVTIRYDGGSENSPPVTRNDEYIVPIGIHSFDVRSNDYDPDGGFLGFPVITRAPSFGSATITSNGLVSYTCSFGCAATADRFEYQITDSGGASATAIVTVGIRRNTGDTLYNANYMTAPEIDGVIGEFEYVNAASAPAPFPPIEGERIDDAISGVRIGYDASYLYLATRINKDLVTDSYSSTGELWQDDSFEVYFDLGNEGSPGYDNNDFVRIFGFANGNPPTVTGINSQAALSHVAACQSVDNSYTVCELRFDLAEMGLVGSGERTFGFDMHWNVDVDGGLREAKYSWCAYNSTDADNVIDAWQDISTIPCKVVLQR